MKKGIVIIYRIEGFSEIKIHNKMFYVFIQRQCLAITKTDHIGYSLHCAL